MRLKRMAAALLAGMLLAACSASAAQANWFIANVELGVAAKEDVKVEAMTPFTLESAAVKITAQKLECTAGVTCSIDGANFGTDHSTGELTFTEVTVDKPLNCAVAGGTITTKPLTDTVIMDPKGGNATFDEFFPETPPTIAEIELVGPLCAVGGAVFPLKGTITGRTENTGVAILAQQIVFNAAEQATGGGSLKLGKEAVTLTGEATTTLSGAKKGEIFGATE